MKTFSMKTFHRFLQKNKLYSCINIFGFAVSLAFVILIADFTLRQLTTDNFHVNKEQIYLLGNENYAGTGYWIGERLQSRYPEIEEYCRVIMDQTSSQAIEVEGKKMVSSLMLADTSFFDLFSFKLLNGDPNQVLATKESAVITESFAHQVFGNENPIGRQILFNAETTKNEEGEDQNIPVSRTITGVIEDFKNSIFPERIQIITNIENAGNYNPSIISPGMQNAGSVILFLKLNPNAEILSKTEEIKTYFSEFFWPYSGGAWKEVTFTPFRDFYFSSLSSDTLNHGNKSFVIILLTIGLAILLFAVINYINLTVAQTGLRAKEMATRRLLGANRGEIFRRFVSESFLLCLLSFFLAYILAFAVQPLASQLLQCKINIIESLSFGLICCYLAATILLGVLSGLAPATIITRYKPIDVVRGSFHQKSKMVFSKVFIVLQNVITIALIAGCITIYLQINHMVNAPLGYEYHDVLDIRVSGFTDNSQIDAFRSEISQLSGVECVSLTCGTPLDRGNNNTLSFGKDRMISFQAIMADSTFLKIFGLEKLSEYNSTAVPSFYINQVAVKEIGLEADETMFKFGKDYEMSYNVSGIYKDFQIGSILMDTPPLLMYVSKDLIHDPNRDFTPWSILVKVNGDHKATFDAINQIFTNITNGEVMQATFMEEQVRDSFATQRNLATIVLIFTGMAVFIGALGLLAMSTYFIQQRRREIAVRKVFGAERREILFQLIGIFLRYVLVAFVLAIPVIWIVMDWWLKDYSYRIKLQPWVFLAAGIFTLLVATLTVLWQCLRASATNPSEAVKI